MSVNHISTVKSGANPLYIWWHRLAYHHKSAEALLYVMFVSGVLLWPRIPLAWQLERWMLLGHMLIGISVFLLIVGAFWSSHRRLIKGSKKQFLRTTGTVIEWLLILSSLSGFYLFFFGKPGNKLSFFVEDIHFYSSWLLAPLVFRHALRWTVFKGSRWFKSHRFKGKGSKSSRFKGHSSKVQSSKVQSSKACRSKNR